MSHGSLRKNATRMMAEWYLMRCETDPKPVHKAFGAELNYGGVTVPFEKIEVFESYDNCITNFTSVHFVEGWVREDKYRKMLKTSGFNAQVYITIRDVDMSEDGTTDRIRNPVTNGSFSKVGDAMTTPAFIIDAPKTEFGGGLIKEELKDSEQQLVYVKVQIIHSSIGDFRNHTFSGIFNKTKASELLYMALSGCCPASIDFRYLNENEAEQQIVIPVGTFVKDLPNFLQKEYGMGSHGITGYLNTKLFGYSTLTKNPRHRGHYKYTPELSIAVDSANTYNVFPTYDAQSAYSASYKKLNIMVVDKEYKPFVEPRTYWVFRHGPIRDVFIYTNDDINLNNDNSQIINNSKSIAIINPIESISDSIKKEKGHNKWKAEGKTAVDTVRVNSSGGSISDMGGELGAISYITAENTNKFTVAQSLNQGKGTYIDITWRYASPTEVYVGQGVKITYLDDKLNVKDVYGVIHEMHTVWMNVKPSATHTAFNAIVVMRIFAHLPDLS